MTEFLLEASEVETRLRQHVLELIEPTIKKQHIVDTRFKDIKAFISNVRRDVDDLLSVRDSAESMSSQIENFRVELAGWDKQRHEHEMKVSNRLSAHELEINSLRQSLELIKGVDHTSVNRTLQNMGDMLSQYKDENTDLRRFCVERLDLNRDKISKLRDEFETRTLAMENQMHTLQDMQTTTNTKIQHIDELALLMNTRVNNCCEGVADLWRGKVSIKCMEEQQKDLTEFANHTNGTVASLKNQFGSLVDDVKAHFETATNVVGRSTASQIEGMRTQYQEDSQRVDRMRHEIEEIVSGQTAGIAKVGSDLDSTRETANSAISGLGNAIDELRKRRDVDQSNLQIETTQIRKQLRELQAVMEGAVDSAPGPATPGIVTTDSVKGGRGGKATVNAGGGAAFNLALKADALATFVESAWMGLACDMQDEKDRQAIGLYGVKTVMAQPDKGMGLPDIAHASGSLGFKRSNMPRASDTLTHAWTYSSSPSSTVRQSTSASPRRSTKGKDPFRNTFSGDTGHFFGSAPSDFQKTAPSNFYGGTTEPVVSLDSRCLSCSGSTATVLAGFKMACLQYVPGQVEYEGATYSRFELVCKRMELLGQARSALKLSSSMLQAEVS